MLPSSKTRFFDKTTKKKAKKYPKVNKWKNSDRASSSSDGETMQHFDSGPIIEHAESENEEKTNVQVIKERNAHLDLWLL